MNYFRELFREQFSVIRKMVGRGGQENIYIRASHSAHSVYNVGILTYPYDIYVVHVNSVCTLKVRI